MSVPARANPFRVERLESLAYRLDDAGWRDLFERFEVLGRRAALVGPEGSGKTTLQREVEARLAAQGWRIRRLRLSRDKRRPEEHEWRALLDGIGPRDLLSVDGIEQLPWWWRRRLRWRSRRAGALLVTTHRPGFLPTLREHRTSVGLLRDLVTELVGEARCQALLPELERLFDVHDGNVRECLLGLYDLWADSE